MEFTALTILFAFYCKAFIFGKLAFYLWLQILPSNICQCFWFQSIFSKPTVDDFVIELSHNVSLNEAIQKADHDAILKLGK